MEGGDCEAVIELLDELGMDYMYSAALVADGDEKVSLLPLGSVRRARIVFSKPREHNPQPSALVLAEVEPLTADHVASCAAHADATAGMRCAAEGGAYVVRVESQRRNFVLAREEWFQSHFPEPGAKGRSSLTTFVVNGGAAEPFSEGVVDQILAQKQKLMQRSLWTAESV